MTTYQVEGEFKFQCKGNSPAEVSSKLKKFLRRDGLIEKDFEIRVSRVKEKNERTA